MIEYHSNYLDMTLLRPMTSDSHSGKPENFNTVLNHNETATALDIELYVATTSHYFRIIYV